MLPEIKEVLRFRSLDTSKEVNMVSNSTLFILYRDICHWYNIMIFKYFWGIDVPKMTASQGLFQRNEMYRAHRTPSPAERRIICANSPSCTVSRVHTFVRIIELCRAYIYTHLSRRVPSFSPFLFPSMMFHLCFAEELPRRTENWTVLQWHVQERPSRRRHGELSGKSAPGCASVHGVAACLGLSR